MQTRLRLVQEWGQQLRALLPGIRATRVATLAVFVLGVLWAGNVTLLKVAQALPLAARDVSTERRLRRWLANRRVPVTAIWRPIITRILASRAGTEMLLALDPTPRRGVGNIYVLGLVAHQRVLPRGWFIASNQTDWDRRERAYLGRLCRVVAGWLPPGGTVTLLCDRGLTSPDLIQVCRSLGWHWVMRVSADARQGPKLVDGRWLWALVTRPGQRWYGTVALFKRVGWITCELSIYWRHGYDAPWLLISDRPAGLARVGEDRRRDQAEATYPDCTRRGWNLGHRKVTDYNRLNRLLVVLFLGLWWAQQVGMRAIRCGERRLFDRADRRELSVARLGRCWLAYLLDHGRPVPLPFHQRCSGWRFAWLF